MNEKSLFINEVVLLFRDESAGISGLQVWCGMVACEE